LRRKVVGRMLDVGRCRVALSRLQVLQVGVRRQTGGWQHLGWWRLVVDPRRIELKSRQKIKKIKKNKTMRTQDKTRDPLGSKLF